MDRDELIDQLTQDILDYVMHGVISKSLISKKIKPKQLSGRFEDFRLLMDLHFILKPEVINFVKDLSKNLRNIKTQTKNEKEIYKGTIEGRISWSSTIKKRYSRNPSDSSLFVCEKKTEHYDIDENLVLKKLLSIVYKTLIDSKNIIEKNHKWIKESWKENENLIDKLKIIFERNVHVTRIRKPSEYEPTDRMIFTAINSRKEIYREAGKLLKKRNKIQNGDRKEIRDLLKKTAITPDDDETLFELYVLFRFISIIEDIYGEDFKLKPIKSGKQEIAKINGKKEIVLYHDSSASDKKLSFKSDVIENSKGDLSRTEMVQKKAHDIIDQYFNNRTIENHTGRPDVIILEVIDEENNEFDYIITEVKYSSKLKTIKRGIIETLEYLAFLKIDDDYVFKETSDYLGYGLNGLLIIQDLEEETIGVNDQETIKILQASEIDEQFRKILQGVLK